MVNVIIVDATGFEVAQGFPNEEYARQLCAAWDASNNDARLTPPFAVKVLGERETESDRIRRQLLENNRASTFYTAPRGRLDHNLERARIYGVAQTLGLTLKFTRREADPLVKGWFIIGEVVPAPVPAP